MHHLYLIVIIILTLAPGANALSPLTRQYEAAKDPSNPGLDDASARSESSTEPLSLLEIESLYGGKLLDRHYLKWQRHKHRWPTFVDYEYHYAKRKVRRGVFLTTTGILSFSLSIPTMILFAPSNMDDGEDPKNEPYEAVPLIFFGAGVVCAIAGIPLTIWGAYLIKKYKRITKKLQPYITPQLSANSRKTIGGFNFGVSVRF